MLESVDPIVWPATEWGNNYDLNVGTRLPVENVVRKTWKPITPNIGWKLDLQRRRDMAAGSDQAQAVDGVGSELSQLVIELHPHPFPALHKIQRAFLADIAMLL